MMEATDDEDWPPANAPEFLQDILTKMPRPTLRDDETDDLGDWDRKSLAIEARAALERSIPMEYRWSGMDAAELPKRVAEPKTGHKGRPPEPPILKAQQCLGATRLIFVGGPGSGKTSLAVAALRARPLEPKRGSLFVAATDLALARSRHKLGDGEAPLVEACMRTAVLLVDDLGYERDLPSSAIPDVIAHRHAQQMATWITTGLRRTELADRYGGGFMRRITERSVFVQCGERMAEPDKTKGKVA